MIAAVKTSRILSAGAIALVAGTAVVAGAAGTAQARVTCPTGFLCFQETANGGRVVRIAEGQSAYFAGGIPVYAATNSTRLTYCVTSKPYDYSLAPGQRVARSHTVFRAAPGTGC
ncbi:hypothetical protein E1281_38700 [Actinomadura sp. KC345]|uniref:hypothetical protein n=1 Tax=Actinomadura sp. KC345 TaxID=2530371 RepID=UPI0010435978|nr:hypothetical protein [Actinomadura sp. KC345]TDC39460.1 hypothetical protein E1281_38700 [Actinomadura sp. KC345]